MADKTTELVFILDRSGSMSDLIDDTIGGFNSLIEKQKKEEGKCLVSCVLFDDTSKVLYDRLSLEEIPKMTEKEYFTRGCTALIDAMGGAIKHIGNIHKYARKEDVPDHTMFVIITDGMENSSHKYSSDYVKELVKNQQEKYGWEFVFIGANIDAVETAKHYGIRSDRAFNYHADAVGTGVVYEKLSQTVGKVRKCMDKDAMYSCFGVLDDIEEDFKSRKKNEKRK